MFGCMGGCVGCWCWRGRGWVLVGAGGCGYVWVGVVAVGGCGGCGGCRWVGAVGVGAGVCWVW